MQKRRKGSAAKRRRRAPARSHVDRRKDLDYTEDERLFSRQIIEPEMAAVHEPPAVDEHAVPERALDNTLTDPWRVFRIMGEFVDGFDALARLDKAVSVFGSARTPKNDPDYKAATETCRLLAEAGFAIITGAGPGIMEAGNKGARQGGGQSIGLNIELPFEQDINPYVDLSLTFRYFFVGGYGTMDELFEALTLIQTGKVHNFPLVMFNNKYHSSLMRWLKNAVLEGGKISPEDLDIITTANTPDQAARIIIDAHEARNGKKARATKPSSGKAAS